MTDESVQIILSHHDETNGAVCDEIESDYVRLTYEESQKILK